jgi:rhodanese-related sulfurtransferase
LAFAPLPVVAAAGDNGCSTKEKTMSIVTEVPAAPAEAALAHFEGALRFETDCWDVHSVLGTPQQDFVLLDVRGTEQYQRGHAPGAVDLARRKIIGSKLAEYPPETLFVTYCAGPHCEYPPETLFVTYCAGPHCNGAARAAIRIARLGRPVKIMTGGVTGWLDEGFELVKP